MNNLKKGISLLFGFIFLFIPLVVNAEAKYSLGDATITNNSATIKININGSSGVEKAVFECSTDNENVKCEISGDYISDNTLSYNSSNDGEIGKITVINNSTDKLESVKVTLKINDGETINKTISLGGKTTTTTKAKSKDPRISKLSTSVGNLSPEFSSDKTNYVLYGIQDTINKVTFNIECDHCKIKINDGSSYTIPLNKGSNDIKIVTISEDGNDTETYNIKAIRGESDYNSSKLKSLSFGEYKLSPEFNSDITEYNLEIPKKINNLYNIMEYELLDDSNNKDSVEIEGADNLRKDESDLIITVNNITKSDKSEYVIHIKKIQDGSINILKYKDNIITYEDENGDKQELAENEFKEKYPDEWKSIQNGDIKFDENGNIKLDDENNDVNNNNNKKSYIWIIVLIVVIVILVIVIGILLFKKDNKKDKKKNEKAEDELQKDIDALNEEKFGEDKTQSDEEIDTYDEEARLESEENRRRSKDEANEDSSDFDEDLISDDSSLEDEDATVDIDKALSDLMNTSEYNFKDKK